MGVKQRSLLRDRSRRMHPLPSPPMCEHCNHAGKAAGFNEALQAFVHEAYRGAVSNGAIFSTACHAA